MSRSKREVALEIEKLKQMKPSSKPRRIYLNITTWLGMGGVHYYGNLASNEEDANDRMAVELQHRIRTDDDFYFNHVLSFERKKKKFTTSIAFRTEKEVIETAILWMKKNEPKGALILGPSYVCDPQKVIYGPKKLMAAANRLNQAANVIHRWDKKENKKKMDEISEQWEKLWGGRVC